MSQYLVTGGCGFVGSHLVEALLHRGDSVVVIDDLSTGKKANLDGFSSSVDLRVGRLEDFNLETLGTLKGVFHLAAQASVPLSIENLYESSSTNLRSTLKVIEYCSKRSVPLVYASSSAVYGSLKYGDENSTIELLSPYAADKSMSEVYTRLALDLYGLRSVGLRFFNVYGPRQDPTSPYSGVISIFSSRLLKGLPLTVFGGHQTRDFVYVSDVVSALLRSHQKLLQDKAAHVSNVLTGRSISINGLVETLSTILKREPVCEYQPLPPGDPEFSAGSTARMESLLGLKLEDLVNFHEGLSATLDWMKTQV